MASLLLPFLIVGVYFVISRFNGNKIWLNYFVLIANSFVPLFSLRYVKKSYHRIILGILLVPMYLFLLVGWLMALGFSFFNEAL